MTSDLGMLCTCFPVLEQCLCNRLQGNEIVLEWVAFSTTKGGLKLSLNTLEQFEHEVGERETHDPFITLTLAWCSLLHV